MKLIRLIPFIALVISTNVFGAVYKCTMPDGKVVYNQTPCQDSSENKELKIQKASPAGSGSSYEMYTNLPALDEAKIKLSAKRQMEIIHKGDANPSDLKALLDAKKRFDDAHELATRTPRISLAGPITRMQDVRQTAERQPVAGCYQKAQEALVKWMNTLLDKMTGFMSGSGSTADLYASTKNLEAMDQEYDFWLSVPMECNGQ